MLNPLIHKLPNEPAFEDGIAILRHTLKPWDETGFRLEISQDSRV